MLSTDEKEAIKEFCDVSIQLRASSPGTKRLRAETKGHRKTLEEAVCDIPLAVEGGFLVKGNRVGYRSLTHDMIEEVVGGLAAWPPQDWSTVVQGLQEARATTRPCVKFLKRAPKGTSERADPSVEQAFRLWKQGTEQIRQIRKEEQEARSGLRERQKKAETLVSKFLEREDQSQRLNLQNGDGTNSVYFMRLAKTKARQRTTKKRLAECVAWCQHCSREEFARSLIAALRECSVGRRVRLVRGKGK